MRIVPGASLFGLFALLGMLILSGCGDKYAGKWTAVRIESDSSALPASGQSIIIELKKDGTSYIYNDPESNTPVTVKDNDSRLIGETQDANGQYEVTIRVDDEDHLTLMKENLITHGGTRMYCERIL